MITSDVVWFSRYIDEAVDGVDFKSYSDSQGVLEYENLDNKYNGRVSWKVTFPSKSTLEYCWNRKYDNGQKNGATVMKIN